MPHPHVRRVHLYFQQHCVELHHLVHGHEAGDAEGVAPKVEPLKLAIAFDHLRARARACLSVQGREGVWAPNLVGTHTHIYYSYLPAYIHTRMSLVGDCCRPI